MSPLPQQQPIVSEDELEQIGVRLRRIFVASSCLTVLIVLAVLLAVPSWHETGAGLRAGLTAILLWSIVVTGYGFHSHYCVSEKVKELLRHKSLVDEVTGVFNYRYLDLRLAEEAERTRRHGGLTSLLYVDLDGFKRVNDRFGHQVGNVVLDQLGTLMSQKARLCDVFGRIGGDEFLAILPQTGRPSASVLAERLRQVVEDYSLDLGDGHVVDFIRLSVGIAAFPTDGETMQAVVNAADRAVYDAKARGGNRIAFAGEEPEATPAAGPAPDDEGRSGAAGGPEQQGGAVV